MAAMAIASVRRKGVLALALSSCLPSRTLTSAFHRAASACNAKTTASDDPSFADDNDYEGLKKGRPMRIYARPIDTNNRSKSNSGMEMKGAPAVTKIVHFQRHGQGTHNELYKTWSERIGKPLDLSETDPSKNPLLDDSALDAPLTQKGKDQCAEQQSAANKLKGVQLIVVGPLLRALQTAHITFEDFLPSKSRGQSVKWMVHEDVREELGLLLCNKRRPLSETMLAFPDMDYTHLPHNGDEDTTWRNHVERTSDGGGGTPRRETMVDMSHRAYRFLVEFVRTRQETEMAVVCHSAWLFAMTNAVLEVTEYKHSVTPMFGQAELRSLELVFSEQ